MLIAHTYPNANSYTDRHVDSDAYAYGNTNSDRDAYTKAFTHTAASTDATTSPIAKSN